MEEYTVKKSKLNIEQPNTIISREELMEKPIEEQRALMSFYNYLRYLGLPTSESTGKKKDVGIATLSLYDDRKKKNKSKKK